MSDKDYGIEFDRQAFVQPPDPAAGRASQTTKVILAMVAFAVIAFLGYELITRVARESASANDPALASLDARLSGIESRLEKLEDFFVAEKYHQNYAALHPNEGYIAGVALPKVDKPRKYFGEELKR